jgi:uncharacterized membrane protein YraQ (UPF0718 family)
MLLNPFAAKTQAACQVHGHHGKSGNRMLAGMLMLSLALIVWHVWTFGPSANTSLRDTASGSFPLQFGNEIWDLFFNRKGVVPELWEVFPYFLVGILLAGYLRTFKVAAKLQMKLRKYGVVSVFLASFVGIITPLCACGTMTTAISLLFAGIPLAPVMALMVTSPLLSPSTYLITLNDLGPEWTVIRTVSAFSMGIFAGLVTHYVSRRSGFGRNDIFIEGAIVRGDFHDDDYPDERLRCNCRRSFGNRVAVRTANKFLIFLAKSSEMLWVVGKYVIVGVFIGAVVERYLPKEWIYRFFGRHDPLNIVWVTLASVPLFLHQISASSILSHIKSSLDGTLDNGAALAFMIGGPVTAIPTMVMFWTFFKKRVFALYMFVCLSGTLLIAYGFQLLLFTPGIDLGNPLLKGVGSLSGGRAAVITKHDPNVRMVMDPTGNGLIATYSNDLEGKGNIVFDTLPDRFNASALGRYDNRTYIANIAAWLDQGADSPSGHRILVYDLTGGASRKEALARELDTKGFIVRVADRSTVPHLSAAEVGSYGQIWFMFAPGDRNGLSEEELRMVSEHNARGKGMLLVAATPEAGERSQQPANSLASRFGVTFSGNVREQEKLRVSVASNLINRASELLGYALKAVKKA